MRSSIILSACGLIVALVAIGLLTFAEVYSSEACEVTTGGTQSCHSESSTLVDENGRWVLGLMAVPVVIAGGMLVATIYRLPVQLEWLLAGGLLAACLLAILSIGFFFLPAAALLIAAAASERRRASV
jgi:hypothetical protein